MGHEKKVLLEIMFRTVMCLYDSAKTRIRVGFAYPKGFEVKVLSPLLFAIDMGVITKYAKTDVINKIFYADDFVFTSKTKKVFEIEECT